MAKCILCEERDVRGRAMCARCALAYDRHRLSYDGTTSALIEWVARRVRRFERKRVRRG